MDEYWKHRKGMETAQDKQDKTKCSIVKKKVDDITLFYNPLHKVWIDSKTGKVHKNEKKGGMNTTSEQLKDIMASNAYEVAEIELNTKGRVKFLTLQNERLKKLIDELDLEDKL